MITTKLKLALLGRYTEKGFALPLAIGFGLAIILIGVTMSLRSQKSQMMVTAQTDTAKSVSAAEIGVTRLQNLIDNNRALGLYCSHSSSDIACNTGTIWSNITADTLKKTKVCQSNSYYTTAIQQISNAGTWQTINTTDTGQWQYRLINYTYIPNDTTKPNEPSGKGILIVEGRINPSSINTATSRLQVTIPIEKNFGNIAVPGMWLKQGDSGSNNTIDGDVFLNDCNGNPTQVQVTTGHEAKYTTMTFPQLPNLPTTNIKNLGNLTGNTGKITLPQSGDPYITKVVQNGGTTETVKVYQYSVNSIDLSGSSYIEITKLQPGDRVTFYLLGDINKTEIRHSCTGKTNCRPTDFQIFGYGTASGIQKQICLVGNQMLEAFILGPDYTAGVSGSGGGVGGIKGSIWVKNWSTGGGCGSNTSNIVVAQTANWGDLGLTPENVPPQLKPISSWEQRAAN